MTKKLSICMIVKNEEQNLPQCLDSIQPLLDKPYTELIVVDTGSDDNTMEIARRYTSQVYFHEWNHNFSEMRNISISYATGEWIFILDADEKIENPEELINLLNRKKISSYNSIQFHAKNVVYKGKEQYIHFITERLFRNDGSFKFTGSVHNQPIFKKPTLLSNVSLIHYGYLNDDKELMERKFKRTSKLLKVELKKNPEHIYYRFQLARSYLMHKDYPEALEEIITAYNLVKKLERSKWTVYYYVFIEYARISFASGHFEDTVNICEKGIQLKPDYIDFYYYLGYALFNLNRKDEGYKALKVYFDLYKKYEKEETNTSQFNSIELYTYDNESRSKTAYKVCNHLYQEKEFIEAAKYLPLIEDTKYRHEMFIKVNLSSNYIYQVYEKYQQLQNNEQKQQFVYFLESEKKNLEKSKQKEFEKIFSFGDDSYAILNQIRIGEHPDVAIKKFTNYYDLNKLPMFPYADVIKFSIQYGISPLSLLKKLKSVVIKKMVKEIVDQSQDCKEYFINYLKTEKVRPDDIQSNRVFTAVSSVVLLTYIEEVKSKQPEDMNESWKELFKFYIDRGIHYIINLYQVERLRLVYKTIENSEDQFFILIYFAKMAQEKGDFKNSLRYYKEAIDTYPYFAELLKESDNYLGVLTKNEGLLI